MSKEVQDVLKQMIEQTKNGQWIVGSEHRDINYLFPTSTDVRIRMGNCAVGMISKFTGSHYSENTTLQQKLLSVLATTAVELQPNFPGSEDVITQPQHTIIGFNDSRSTDGQAVQWFEKALKKAEVEG